MNEIEAQAHELLRHREWVMALELFDQLISQAIAKGVAKERIVLYLLGRSECFVELGRHEAVVSDCRKIIKLLDGGNSANSNGARVWKRLVHALFTLQRFHEAEAAAVEWIAASGGITEAVRLLEQVRMVLQVINKRDMNRQLQYPSCGEEMFRSEFPPEVWNGHNLEEMKRNRKHPVKLIESNELEQSQLAQLASLRLSNHEQFTVHQNIGLTFEQQFNEPPAMLIKPQQDKEPPLSCIYCGLCFRSRSDLKSHCMTESHQRVIMSDEGRDWKWRPPPRGHTVENYALCENWIELGTCRYGAQCVEAHGPEELVEWRERFEYRRMKLQRASEKELYGKSYTEVLLERWSQTPEPAEVMRENLEGVEDACSSTLGATMSSKESRHSWTFTLTCQKPLRAVALLQDTYRNHFFLTKITTSNDKGDKLLDIDFKREQEWTESEEISTADLPLVHHVTVVFSTDIYGTFRQSIVFDFFSTPVLVKHLCVDVIPVTDVDKMKELKKELILSSGERWNKENSIIVTYSSISSDVTQAESERESELLAAYPPPSPVTFTLTQATVSEKRPTKNNYRARMHELLFVEEMARYELVANYNIQARLQIAKNYLLSPSGVAASTAKYAHNGELFALLNLGKNVSEDTSAGRLILNNCTTVLISPVKFKNEHKEEQLNEKEVEEKRIVYEALIEDKGKNVVYLRLSAATVQALNLKPETKVLLDVQFQLNRVPYCEWHQAIDKIADFRMIFPDTYVEPTIPWSPQRQWSGSVDSKLNPKQKEAVMAITTPLEVQLPPILIIGPFGTGKTYTLAQGIKEVLKQPGSRVLVCTHSNSAADLYIREYLHPYVEAGHEEARPLRIFYHRRWVATVNHIVQKYAMIETNEQGMRAFKIPKVEDILKHRVIVVTLSISMHLSTMGLRKGHFTHILLDEAAQAMECEAIMPLALANESTRIVLAGDHMQLSPELFSEFAKERNLHISLLERLYDHYPTNFPCKILLCENYRAHEAIIQFTSELFYEQKLVSSGKQPRHDHFYPLTFFTTRGEDVQDQNSTAFYNNSEVYEVVERVCELKKKWPVTWGKLDEQSIGIMTPYSDQVFRIRSELRKRRLGGISVERVLNVQGKQFRAIFLSTVRTRRTCDSKSGTENDYGFLSNSKLLNTAITRAQSLVAVVGDPVSLCTIGRCRKVWERFIQICSENGSLYGIKWSYLRSQLDGVELKKMYTLNPLAPEFVPRQYREPKYFVKPVLNGFPPLLRFPQQQQQQQQPFLPAPQIMPYPILYPAVPFFPIRTVYPPPPPPIVYPPNIVIKNDTQAVQPLVAVRPPPPLCSPNLQQQFVRPVIQQQMPVERKPEKRDIQFLHNVHFPNSIIHLLPKDIPLEELLESQSKQLQWYNYLLNTVGFEAATKFAEFLARAPRKQDPVVELNSSFNDLYIQKPVQPPPMKRIDPVFSQSIQVAPIQEVCISRSWLEKPSLFPNGYDSEVVSEEVTRNGSLPLYQRQPGMSSTYAEAVKSKQAEEEVRTEKQQQTLYQYF
ncbi:unnamed protein product [Nezara viridula]|uniref:Helicase with zinc finger domain n=1 Tax=Nezara viridula TaxID=85310 RepID=A0A9P0H9N2_NEZVI|nr:unnamed protein product [Nezara viridula]